MEAKYIVIGAVITLLTSGCDRKSAEKASETPEVRQITLLAWSEYFDPEVLTQFEEESGIGVDYQTFEELDELEAKLNSEPGRYDVVIADDSSLQALKELRLIAKIEHARVPNLVNIDPLYLDRKFDPGNEYSIPYAWGTTLIAYRSDKIVPSSESWAMFRQAGAKGKAMWVAGRTEALGLSLLALGLPLNSDVSQDLDRAGANLCELVKNYGLRFGGDASVREGLLSGDVWVAACYSGDAAMVAEENENIAYFIPEEGAPLWLDNFAISSSSRKQVEGAAFVNFMLRPESAAANANFTWYASPNAAAQGLISAELRDDPAITPPETVLERCRFFVAPDRMREGLLNAAWGGVQRALRQSEALATAGDGASE